MSLLSWVSSLKLNFHASEGGMMQCDAIFGKILVLAEQAESWQKKVPLLAVCRV
jgi:hypothetical protein